MTYLDRILSDGTDREQWKAARFPVIGASDAKILSKMESVPLYLAGKLKRDVFTGNVFTDNGYRWEPLMLAWAGYDHNVALFHAPDEPGFACTPDGIKPFGDGDLALAEAKAKHVDLPKRIKGPTLQEWRQIAWQLLVLPEAFCVDWICAELAPDKNGEPDLIDSEPWKLRVYRDDPKVIELQQQIRPIATELLFRLRAALAYERPAA